MNQRVAKKLANLSSAEAWDRYNFDRLVLATRIENRRRWRRGLPGIIRTRIRFPQVFSQEFAEPMTFGMGDSIQVSSEFRT